GGVVDLARSIVEVADRAIEIVIIKDAMDGLFACEARGFAGDAYVHVCGHLGRTCTDELAVDLHHARVAGLERAQALVKADLRDLDALAIQDGEQALAGQGRDHAIVDAESEDVVFHSDRLAATPWVARSSCGFFGHCGVREPASRGMCAPSSSAESCGRGDVRLRRKAATSRMGSARPRGCSCGSRRPIRASPGRLR